jgi:hypothetical protein
MTAEELVGQKIKAADACYYPDREPRLLIGKLYEIIAATQLEYLIEITIINDFGVEHDFYMNADGTFEEYECIETKTMQKPFYDLQ